MLAMLAFLGGFPPKPPQKVRPLNANKTSIVFGRVLRPAFRPRRFVSACIAPRSAPRFPLLLCGASVRRLCAGRGRRAARGFAPVPIFSFVPLSVQSAFFNVPSAHYLKFSFRDPTLKAEASRPRLEAARKAEGGRLAAALAAFYSAAPLPPNAHPRPPPFKERKKTAKNRRRFFLLKKAHSAGGTKGRCR